MEQPWSEKIRLFYLANRQALYTYALTLTGDSAMAEDAIHTVFAAWLARRSPPRELRPYVFRSVRHAALDGLKARTRRNGTESIFKDEPGADPHVALAMDDALAELGDDERETIVLKIYGGLTFKEIAHARDESLNTAASRYRRGLAKLAELLKETPQGRP
ncbi:MAG: sigma-70 family RNA polymerase sigma factor [Planctomycetes bacterium]|nr:sigma-70 family RNA polymerase sigma factor [Planctomycetota bacterium]